MSKFYLVRHGEKEKVAGDPGLTEIGKKQSLATSKYFKNKKIKAIYSSPFKRTTETAEYINPFKRLKIVLTDDLRERANWGDLLGQSHDEFLDVWIMCDKDRNYIPPSGDSSKKAGERFEKCLRELHKKHVGDEIVLVTHGGVIADFLFNVFPSEYLVKHNPTFIKRDGCRGIIECSITVINFDGKKFELEKLAGTDHLKI